MALEVLEMVQNTTALDFLRAEASSVSLEAEAAHSVHRATQLQSVAAATLASARIAHQFILNVAKPKVLFQIIHLGRASTNNSHIAMLHSKEADKICNKTKVIFVA